MTSETKHEWEAEFADAESVLNSPECELALALKSLASEIKDADKNRDHIYHSLNEYDATYVYRAILRVREAFKLLHGQSGDQK